MALLALEPVVEPSVVSHQRAPRRDRTTGSSLRTPFWAILLGRAPIVERRAGVAGASQVGPELS
jgi:hypothetical protein